ncbi:MAG TPA: hypothetical protein VK752_06715 [Bryobacteraceae bacterium]|jgi:hypothetical protein|nr:hypothetical protein [Bryobacteraceae bacterium]
MAKVRVVCAFVALMAMMSAQRPITVTELVSFIKDSIKRRQDDRLVADYLLKRMKMKERLDDKTVEELEGFGAGPRTMVALRKLSKESAGLAVAAPAAPPPPAPVALPLPAPPSSVEQESILDEIRTNAINYSNNLPNFLCTQVTRRTADPTGTGEHWKQLDTIQEQLSFFDHREKYVVTMVNGQAVTNRDHQKLGGATSEGEFGSMLYDIFNPATEAEFHWEKWGTWRGHRMHVYSFEVTRERSRYDIYHGPSDRHVVSAYKGLIYADATTKNVMRILMECVNLPYDFPIQAVTQELVYEIAKISDQPFLLPEKSELSSRENHYLVKNVISYHLYRKFTTDEKIIYDEIPEDKPPAKKQP